MNRWCNAVFGKCSARPYNTVQTIQVSIVYLLQNAQHEVEKPYNAIIFYPLLVITANLHDNFGAVLQLCSSPMFIIGKYEPSVCNHVH